MEGRGVARCCSAAGGLMHVLSLTFGPVHTLCSFFGSPCSYPSVPCMLELLCALLGTGGRGG
jgi:hypothetical protein